ncbi:hypothetical protein [Bradyrhizobium australafricanum]|uniref:hypothetical protein n=1 Tax=Bradyrhizobium australafricanum TaxID=2821406 RepID=UPI001CE31079|nr:hypothetical protein [Bradyrhizobium australafricanum]MCA6098883.1 hypothetical protein [Bradyrhizobium australafricanum]
MIWILSYLSANFALVLATGLGVLALAAIAWFTKNWKAAVAAGMVLIAGLAYQQIDHNAYNRAQAEQKAREVAVLQGRIAALERANAADAARATADAAEISRLRQLASQTPANDTPCLPLDAAKRVEDIH